MINFINQIKRAIKDPKIYFLIPLISFVLIVVLIPMGLSLFWSFSDLDLLESQKTINFIGLSNYFKLISDPSYINSIKVTILFVFGAVGGGFAISLVLALLLNEELKARTIFQTILIIPLTMAPVVTALIWRWMYHPSLGVLNYFLNVFGFSKIMFLSDYSIALVSLIIVDIWNFSPFMILVFLAGLLNQPQEIFDAAKVDGASSIQQIKFIILPLLKPIISVVLLIRTMDAFKVFDTAFLITKGGPGESTRVLGLEIYYTAFRYFKMGFACAQSWILIPIVGIIVFLYLKIIKVESI
jgi:multiple sugar transport system permease protein